MIQSLFDGLLPKGLQWYWKGDFVKELSDDLIDAHVKHASQSPTELSLMHLYPIDKAVHRVKAGDTAWSAARPNLVDGDRRHRSRPKERGCPAQMGPRLLGGVHKFNKGGGYVNFMMDDESDDRLQTTYGPNYKRLVEIKKKYDPTIFSGESKHPPGLIRTVASVQNSGPAFVTGSRPSGGRPLSTTIQKAWGGSSASALSAAARVRSSARFTARRRSSTATSKLWLRCYRPTWSVHAAPVPRSASRRIAPMRPLTSSSPKRRCAPTGSTPSPS